MKPRVALLGNIANNAYNVACQLRACGHKAVLFLDPNDKFPFSQPAWEDLPLRLEYDDVMNQTVTVADWNKQAHQHCPQDGRLRFIDILDKATNAPHLDWLKERMDTLCAGWLEQAREFASAAARGYAAIIREIAEFDLAIVFGVNPAICAFLADIPFIYFTYGGDIRVVLAGQSAAVGPASAALLSALSSPKAVIEAYGCDEEIHDILAAKGLTTRSRFAFLSNVNIAQFSKPWSRGEARRNLGLSNDAFIVFMPSRINYRWKRNDIFLDAWHLFSARHTEARLLLSGWGDDYERAKARYGDPQGEKTHFMRDAVSKPLLFEYMAAADVIVDQFQVGSLGSVSYEAMCMGKPVLTYVAPFNQMNFSSPPPVFNALDPKGIDAVLERAVQDDKLLAQVGKRAREWYAEVYGAQELERAVCLLAKQGPDKWLALVDKNRDALFNHEISFPAAPTAKVLRWPWPYRSGLSISNDCEFMTWEHFVRLHNWLNNKNADLNWGDGLGLPISDSLWFYNENDTGFSFFEGTDPNRQSTYAPRLAELLRLGILDTVHAWGGFDVQGGFRREHAIAALETLRQINAAPSVWTNHGNAHNHQNLGGLWANDYQHGDLLGCPQYHADLLRDSSLRFYWLDACCTNRFSLGNAQGRKFKSNLAKPEAEPLLGDKQFVRDILRDGHEVMTFRRFRGNRRLAPDVESLAEQISEANLDHLEASEGSTIVYQHLGCLRASDGTPRCCPSDRFPQKALVQLRSLADRYQSNSIWVAPLARFLTYQAMVNDLRLEIIQQDARVSLRVSGLRNNWKPEDFQGLSVVVYGGGELSFVCKAPDGGDIPLETSTQSMGNGHRLAMVPVRPLPKFPFSAKD